MITNRMPAPEPEPEAGKPVASAEQWLGWNEPDERRLWEQLAPPHRKQLRILGRALVAWQGRSRLPEELHARLGQLVGEAERVIRRIERLLGEQRKKEAGLG